MLFFFKGTGLQAQAIFKEKLTFRPHSTSSQTHRKMTLSIADRASKAQKIKMLPAAGMDPEAQRSELIKVNVLLSNAPINLKPAGGGGGGGRQGMGWGLDCDCCPWGGTFD